VKIKFSVLVDEARALVDQASPINQLFCIKFTSLPNGRRLDTQHNDTWHDDTQQYNKKRDTQHLVPL
jgi:hypothetical protein